MEFNNELGSKSAPRIEKAARKIADDSVEGYEDVLISTLDFLFQKKTKSWKAQAEIIRAIGITGTEKVVPYLKELALKDFSSLVLYRYLGFSICLLEDIKSGNLSYLNSILKSSNQLLISGACSALLFSEFIPENKDIKNILKYVVNNCEDEGILITPRCYIAAACYSWPSGLTKAFLLTCAKSNFSILNEISKASLTGIKTKQVLI